MEKTELFSVQNDNWKLTETSPGIFSVESKTKPGLNLTGCTLKELATLEGPVSELKRHLEETHK